MPPSGLRNRYAAMRPRFGLDAGRLLDQMSETGRDVLRFAGVSRALARRRAAPTADAVFVWVPKTAGTSLWEMLEAGGGQKLTDPHRARWEFAGRGVVTFGHADYRMLVEEGLVSPEFAARAYSFAVVRNPYDRAISLFEYLRHIELLPAGLAFPLFAELLADGGFEPIGSYNAKGLSQCNPQVAWLVDDAGDVLVDDVFRFERLDEAVEVLRARLSLTGPMPRVNATPRRPAAEYFTSASVRRNIERCYAADFERFDY